MDIAGFNLQERLEKAESAEEMGRILVKDRGPEVVLPVVRVLEDHFKQYQALEHQAVEQAKTAHEFLIKSNTVTSNESILRWCPTCKENVFVDYRGVCSRTENCGVASACNPNEVVRRPYRFSAARVVARYEDRLSESEHVHEPGSCSVCDIQASEDAKILADMQAAMTSASQEGAVDSALGRGRTDDIG